MKEFFKTMLIEPFRERYWLDWVAAIFMWVIMIALSIGLVWLSVWLIDSKFLPINEKDGVIVNKYIIPEHSEATFIMAGKVMVPITNFIQTEYVIDISIDGISDDVEVCEHEWSVLNVNEKVFCKYTKGRILKSIYIKSFIKIYSNGNN